MTKRILIMGLPGAGKTTLAREIYSRLVDEGHTVSWHNADDVRKRFNDWDFSSEGRIRQSERMRVLSDLANVEYAIADFVAPLPEMRDIYGAHYTVWVDTITEGRFADTNKAFVEPESYDMRVTTLNSTYWADVAMRLIT